MNIECPHCHHPLSLALTSAGGGGGSSVPQLNLRDLITSYATEHHQTGAWSEQWKTQATTQLRRFQSAGHPLTRQGVAAWKAELITKYGVKTVNIHLSTLGTFCRWLENRGDLPANPCLGQAVRGSKVSKDAQRLAFEASEVRSLLDAAVGEGPHRDLKAPSKGFAGFVWSMAYTGARNEEIAQLRLCDVGHFGDTRIVCFDMQTDDDNQKRKTSASRRVVPVHSKLQKLLGTSMALVPSNASEVILRNLWGFNASTRKGRFAYEPSRWANEVLLTGLKVRGVIRDDPRLTLYSLRHSVATLLKYRGVPEVSIAELVGHTNASMTTGRYGKRFPVEQLQEVVEIIEW